MIAWAAIQRVQAEGETFDEGDVSIERTWSLEDIRPNGKRETRQNVDGQ